ncbi:MAG: hypothetical protein L0G99_14945 [Propionibacteriales bacterium]|nr:hypothetical protein [Propionibacteriales bacterium]
MPDAEIGVFGDHQVAAASEQIWCDEGVPWGVLWFSHHPGAAALESAHRVLAADLLESIGPPIDATDTTAAWRAGEFLVEAYAYFPDERVKRSTHQVSVLRERMAGFVGV